MAEIQVICPECGKKVSLRGLNGHLRFDHNYGLEKAKKMASGIDIDTILNRLEQDIMSNIHRFYQLHTEANELKKAREDGLISEALYDRMLTNKGQELTATTRYLKRLDDDWQERIEERTGVKTSIDSKDEFTLGSFPDKSDNDKV